MRRERKATRWGSSLVSFPVHDKITDSLYSITDEDNVLQTTNLSFLYRMYNMYVDRHFCHPRVNQMKEKGDIPWINNE